MEHWVYTTNILGKAVSFNMDTLITMWFSMGILIVIALAILIIPSCDYIKFMFFQKTSVFRIPLTVIFAPFAYFLCSIIGYTISDIISEIKTLKNPVSETPAEAASEEVRS